MNYDTFDSQEMLETKLLATKSGYDVVVVASDKLARLGPIGVFRKLDYGLLPSSKNLDPALHAALATRLRPPRWLRPWPAAAYRSSMRQAK